MHVEAEQQAQKALHEAILEMAQQQYTRGKITQAELENGIAAELRFADERTDI